MVRPGAGLPFVLDVDRRRARGPGGVPLSAQIVDAVVAAVRSGRLRKGDRLPGARALASSLGVDRSTVDAAVRGLEAQGVVVVVPKSGVRISADLPSPLRTKALKRSNDEAGFDVAGGVSVDDDDAEGAVALWGGTPDVSLLPRAALARAFREVLLGKKSASLLGYGDVAGAPALRSGVAALLRESRGLAVTGDDVVITGGSQMALDLCARALVRPGDVVVVEDPGYPPARGAFLARGAYVAPIAVDADGLDVDAVAELLSHTRVRAIVVTPHHQYPTTVTLSAARRLRLLELCARHRVVVIEDDYDHEFHYEGRPIAPLIASDSAGVVVSVGSLSKILAPGLRVGWLTAPRVVVDAVVAARRFVDRQGDHLVEAALAVLLDDGEVARHARRMRRVYRERRDALVELLRHHLGDSVDVDRWIAAALALGVKVQPTSQLYIDGRSRPFLRLGFAGNDVATLQHAVQALTAARDRVLMRRHA